MRKILNKKGFTLVELMVVVAIMGVLVAIAVPVYSNVTDQAEAGVCEANRRTYDSAIMMWQLADVANNDVADLVAADFTAAGELAEYMKDGAAPCPAGGTYSLDAGADNTAWTILCSEDGHGDAATPTP